MNNIFADMIDINVIVCLGQHLDKCEFHVTSCEYLSYMLLPDSLTMAQNKVQIIQDWAEPQKEYPVFPQFHEFLLSFHLWIFKDHLATHGANLKRCPLALY